MPCPTILWMKEVRRICIVDCNWFGCITLIGIFLGDGHLQYRFPLFSCFYLVHTYLIIIEYFIEFG